MDATLSGETRNNGSGSEADNQGVQEPTARSDLVLPEKPGPLEEQVPGTPGLNQAAQEPRGRCHQEPRAGKPKGEADKHPTARPQSRKRSSAPQDRNVGKKKNDQ